MSTILGITYSGVKALPPVFVFGPNGGMLPQIELAHRVKALMQAKGSNPKDLATLCNVRVPSVYDWLDSGRIAKKHLPKLAAYFGVSVHFLLGEEEDGEEDLDPLERQLLMLYRLMPEDFRAELLERANSLHNLATGNKRSPANPYGGLTPPPGKPEKK